MENDLFNDENEDLARAALIASGASNTYDLDIYLDKIEQLCCRASISPAIGDIAKARSIFRWLWRTRPVRWVRRGNFRLTDVLDAQLYENSPVGNCLGLTILFNVLAQRYGLIVRTGYLEEAFGIGPHVFTIMYTQNGTIDIENMLPRGFDYDQHQDNLSRQEWNDRQLVAEIHHSIANQMAEEGRWREALDSYDIAIKMNPGHTRARLNKGIALAELGMIEEAKRWFVEGAGLSRDDA